MAIPKRRPAETIAASTVEEVVSEFARVMTEFRADVARSLDGIKLRGARPVAVGINPGATSRPTTSAGAIMGFSFTNHDPNTAADITIYLYDGPDSDAPTLFEVTLAPGESAREWFDGGIHIGDQGLYVHASGVFSGMVFMQGVR